VSADDLARADGAESAESRRLATRLDGLVESAVEEFQTWSNGKERRAAAEALTERADREREAELAALWRRYPELDRDARAAIEGMSRHLAARLLREPLSRLGRDRDGRHERAVRDLFGL
jgi:glutamyl-tRNA reductase